MTDKREQLIRMWLQMIDEDIQSLKSLTVKVKQDRVPRSTLVTMYDMKKKLAVDGLYEIISELNEDTIGGN